MEVVVDLRVVRGPDWMWRDQDGGEGHVGTVVQVETEDRLPDPASSRVTPPPPKAVVVQWECGKHYRCRYRCGAEGKYDLRVLDCAQAGLKHPGMVCNWCLEEIFGSLWKCSNCFDYHLCTACYMAGKHSVIHRFERIDTRDKTKRTQLGPRYSAREATAWGIFPEAQVIRGNDWRWGDQDGGIGRPGEVIRIKQWDGQAVRNVAEVKWRDTGMNNVYRVALGGKVDLKCQRPASGGSYYPEHLPTLGAPCIQLQPLVLSCGDVVTIAMDPDLFKIAQEEHGGWDDIMAEFIGRNGVITAIHDNEDIVVRYSNNKILQLNPAVLTKVETPHFTYGEVVRVLDDIAVVHQLQKGHGDWSDEMALSLGQVGRVLKIKADGDVRMAVNGERWIFNPQCLVSAPGEIPIEEHTGELHVDVRVKLHLHSLAEANCADVVVTAAATGDVDALTSYLKKHPHEVNTKMEDNAALHVAVLEGFIPIVKAILQFHPDLEIEDEAGDRPLHLCAYNNNAEAARLLVGAGADVNARNGRGTTPLAVAAATGHCDVLKVFIEHPHAGLNVQDSEGKTPLHNSITSMRRRSLVMLLEAGANPALLNFRLLNPFHNSSGFGFMAGMEELVKRYPQLINVSKDDGYTPLHVAAVTNHTDIVGLLASHHACDLNAKTRYDKLTPLHIAVHEGCIKAVELLVGFGADLNVVTTDGNTPLHLALGRGTMRAPSEDTPEINELEDELAKVHGRHTLSPNVIVGFFLVREGSELFIKNQKGVSPLQVRPTDVSTLLGNFSKDHRPSVFRGSLRTSINPFADLPPIYHVTPRKEEPPSPVVHKMVSHAQGGPSLKVGRGLSASDETGQAQSSTPSTPPPAGHALNREAQLTKGFSKDDGKTPTNVHHKDINKYTDTSTIPMPSLATAAADVQTPCFLCEEPADVKFVPCGHVVMCRSCSERTRKCPDCRALIHSTLPVCAVCRKKEAVITHPCGHQYCRTCAAESSRCLLCYAK